MDSFRGRIRESVKCGQLIYSYPVDYNSSITMMNLHEWWRVCQEMIRAGRGEHDSNFYSLIMYTQFLPVTSLHHSIHRGGNEHLFRNGNFRCCQRTLRRFSLRFFNNEPDSRCNTCRLPHHYSSDLRTSSIVNRSKKLEQFLKSFWTTQLSHD
jgi:hypothetical protein